MSLRRSRCVTSCRTRALRSGSKRDPIFPCKYRRTSPTLKLVKAKCFGAMGVVKNPWRDVKVVERLVELRGRGHSIPEVAQKLSEEFDAYLTRRAVVGKMSRL